MIVVTEDGHHYKCKTAEFSYDADNKEWDIVLEVEDDVYITEPVENIVLMF